MVEDTNATVEVEVINIYKCTYLHCTLYSLWDAFCGGLLLYTKRSDIHKKRAIIYYSTSHNDRKIRKGIFFALWSGLVVLLAQSTRHWRTQIRKKLIKKCSSLSSAGCLSIWILRETTWKINLKERIGRWTGNWSMHRFVLR